MTQRQKDILKFIKEYYQKNNLSPSFEEIKREFHLSSVSTVAYHINKLEKYGKINKDSSVHRGISVIENEPMVQVSVVGTLSGDILLQTTDTREVIGLPRSKVNKYDNVFAFLVSGEYLKEEGIDDGDLLIIGESNVLANGKKVVTVTDKGKYLVGSLVKSGAQINIQFANKQHQYSSLENTKILGVVIEIIKTLHSLSLDINFVNKDIKKQAVPINKVIWGDSVEVMRKIPDNSVDMVVTSPPYDNVRSYNGFEFDLHATGKELYRVLKDGGIVAMVIQDQTKNFGKTMTSFRTIVDWVDNIGFKLFETVIYRKHGTEGAWWKNRFRVDHEYIPIFIKGDRPQYFNKERLKIPSKHGGKIMTGSGNRKTDGTTTKTVTRPINPTKCRGTIWNYLNAGDKNPLKRKHPAVFPDQIPIDLIDCFCPIGGIVLDPFVGSGSVLVASKNLDRNYIGIDISKEYCELSKERIKVDAPDKLL